MRSIIFTGAGAGKADGIPLQTELFSQFFSTAALPATRHDLANDVANFFIQIFKVDPRNHVGVSLPTFEEALGVLELAIAREEGILGIGEREALGDLRHLRRQLILALAATIASDVMSHDTVHSQLIASLRDQGLLQDVAFVTTNYDTLLDDAIEAQAIVNGRGTGSLLDYGLAGLLPRETGEFAETRKFECYKIHGSLNWLYCPVCDVLDITYASVGVTTLLDEPDAAKCPTCVTFRTPVIVPPSYYKDISNVHLAVVWNRASRSVQNADQVVFCGYSFPDADMHVKYLLKRAQLNRDLVTRPLRAAIVNHHAGKGATAIAAEYARFARFMGEEQIWDTHLSFEEFASNPAQVLQASW